METQHDRLRRARIARGFGTAVEAAHALGVPEQTYSQHENGHRNFPWKRAKDYARFFGVTAGWLMEGDGGEPRGLAEARAVPWTPPQPSIWALIELTAPGLRHRAVLRLTAGADWANLEAGDLLVVERAAPPAAGDLAVVTLTDETGEPAPLTVMRYAPPWYLAGAGGRDMRPESDNHLGVHGVIRAVIRAPGLSVSEAPRQRRLPAA